MNPTLQREPVVVVRGSDVEDRQNGELCLDLSLQKRIGICARSKSAPVACERESTALTLRHDFERLSIAGTERV